MAMIWIALDDTNQHEFAMHGGRMPTIAAKIRQQIADRKDPRYQQFINAAEGYHEEGELEFDHGANVSFSTDDGAWVMCWKWICNSEAGIKNDDEEDDEENLIDAPELCS